MTKQLKQAITPTHVLGSTGTSDAANLGYRSLANFKADIGLSPLVTSEDATINSLRVGIGAGSLATNAVLGRLAMSSNTTGGSNAAVGDDALRLNTTGGGNVAVGANSMESNTIGIFNVAVGGASLDANISGDGNTAVGLASLGSAQTADNNTALGFQSLTASTSGENGTAIGSGALLSNTSGSNNVAVGKDALKDTTTGSGNIGIGFTTSAGTYAPSFNPTTETNRLVAGHTSITNAYVKVSWTIVSDARDKTEIGGVPHGLDFVNQLNPVSYQFKAGSRDSIGDGINRYGFLAQDILQLEGDAPVIIDNEDAENLRYRGESMVPILVNAIKELSAEIEKLKGGLNGN
jgi:trimeric autotransporter adhesin